MKSRSRNLADKSLEAMLAAMEVYNKPSFSYREESFSILAINAWELLLKARVLQLSGNRLSAILKYERRSKADGSKTQKKYRVRSRSGSSLSIGLFRAADLLRNEFGDPLAPAVRENLELLCEVRDNAVHFMNKGFDVSRLVQEIGTACLRNYLELTPKWFGVNLLQYNFFLMPLAFVGDSHTAEVVSLASDEGKVLDYLRRQIAASDEGSTGEYSVALRLDLKFSRSSSDSAVKVVISDDPSATPVSLSEEDIRERYPWTFKILTTRLRKRYSDFSANQHYHDTRRECEKDSKLCMTRFLDPGKRSGAGMRFYSPNIVREFDKHYTRMT